MAEMDGPNRVWSDQPVRGETAYVYAFKARAKRHHCLGYGTFSVSLERIETLRRRYSRVVSAITYLPIYVKATAIAVARSPEANAILFRKLFGLRIVRFERVDVNVPITRRLGDRWITFIGTVRNAADKSLAEIQGELTEYQRCPPERSFAIRRIQRFEKMPLWMARLVHARMTWSPDFYVQNVGTCGVTIVEGDGHERGFPIAPTSVVFGIGSARREPVVRGDEVTIGRVLKCSLMVDNYVVSGRVGARLITDFKGVLESGSFVTEELKAEVP
jgi:pyruvate dehydrogenase E2 component (dihydrolipoyllysine-residue acetyltransferase)